MNLTSLEKAKALYERVKELDAEITQVEKLAALVVSKKFEVKLKLNFTDLEKPAAKEKVDIDDDGSLRYGGRSANPFTFSFLLDPYGKAEKKEEKKHDEELKQVVDDATTLKILGVVLQEKTHVRELAIKKLQKIGIKI